MIVGDLKGIPRAGGIQTWTEKEKRWKIYYKQQSSDYAVWITTEYTLATSYLTSKTVDKVKKLNRKKIGV